MRLLTQLTDFTRQPEDDYYHGFEKVVLVLANNR